MLNWVEEKIHAQLSWAWKKFYNLQARLSGYINFMLDLAEHELFSAEKYENANYC